MTFKEWRPIAAFIESCWKDEFDQTREAAYYRALSHLPATLVDRAVTALAGGRALTNPPLSASGTYSPSCETIARECAAQDRIGSWPWAYEVLSAWIRDMLSDYRTHHGGWVPPDEYFANHQDVLLAMGGEHGPRLIGFVESFGLSYLVRHGGGTYFQREARYRWEHIAADVGHGGQLVQIAP